MFPLSSTQKSFSVIFILVVIFTFVIFGQIQCQKNVTFTVFSFCHLYSVILTSLLKSPQMRRQNITTESVVMTSTGNDKCANSLSKYAYLDNANFHFNIGD